MEASGSFGNKKKKSDKWSDDGQFAVISNNLIITSAHVCFHDINQDKRKANKNGIIEDVKNNKITINSNKTSTEYASDESKKKFPPKYEEFTCIQAVFHEPVFEHSSHIPSSCKYHSFACEVIRCSDSMDLAILRICKSNQNASSSSSSSSSNNSLVPLPFSVHPSASLDLGLNVTLIAFEDQQPTPAVLAGQISRLFYENKKSGSMGQFLLCTADYATQSGYSGGAVLCWDYNKKDWVLCGIHTGADYKGYSEEEKKKNSRSSSPARSSSGSISGKSDTSDSYSPSLTETPEISQTEVGLAAQHVQTNSSQGIFVGIDSVLSRPHWTIDYVNKLTVRSGSVPRTARGVKRAFQSKRTNDSNVSSSSSNSILDGIPHYVAELELYDDDDREMETCWETS